jgi:exodeoxyribonuclease V gamma subunit
MPLNVFFSNNLNALFDKFITLFKSSWQDPFDAPCVIVPNFQTANWLKTQIIKKHGIDAVWTYYLLENFINERIKEYKNQLNIDDDELTSIESLTLYIINLLLKTEKKLSWLYGTPLQQSDKPLASRLIILANTISGLFLEYFSSRILLVEAWEKENDFFTSGRSKSDKEEERFQRQIYKNLFDNKKIKTISHELLLLKKNYNKIKTDKKLLPVFIFNISGMGMAYHEFFSFESKFRDIYSFVLNPCSAFWEDIVTTRDEWIEKKYSLKKLKNFVYKPEEKENLLLKSMGDFGRNIVKIWSERAEDYSNTEYIEILPSQKSEQETLLKKIQKTVLFRMPKVEKGYNKTDNSLQVFACSSKLRQFEILRDWIFDLIKDKNATGNKIMLTDIGIYLPDPKDCLAEISYVFDSYPPKHPLHIPWALEESYSSLSIYAKAVESYLNLMHGPFTRSEFIEFISNSLVMEKLNISSEELSAYLLWISELNIVRGYNKEHRLQIDKCEDESCTWEYGIKRLILGIISNGIILLGNNKYLTYRDISTQDKDSLYKFVWIIESLWEQRQTLQNILAEKDGWKKASLLIMENLLMWVDPDDEKENAVKNDFYNSLGEIINKLKDFPETQDKDLLLELFLKWVFSFLPERVSHFYGSSGVLLFRTLKVGNVFPHKITALVNFGSANFPGEKEIRPLDLRTFRPQDDDADKIQRNKHAFLEALMNTQEKLAIFYPSIDEVTGEKNFPSSAVYELLETAEIKLEEIAINTPLYAEEGFEFEKLQIPKNPFFVIDPVAISLAKSNNEIENKKNKEQIEYVEQKKEIFICSDEDINTINLFSLKNWLDDPFTHRIKQIIGHTQNDNLIESLIDEEDFYKTNFEQFLLIKSILIKILKDFATNNKIEVPPKNKIDCKISFIEKYFNKEYEIWSLKNKTIEGFWENLDKKILFDNTIKYVDNFLEEINQISNNSFCEVLNLYREDKKIGLKREGITFNDVPIVGRRVIIKSTEQPVIWENNKKILHLFEFLPISDIQNKKTRYSLLLWLFARAVSVMLNKDFLCIIHLIESEKKHKIEIKISADNSYRYLKELLLDYFIINEIEHLPLKVIENLLKNDSINKITKSKIEKEMQRDLDSEFSYFSEYIKLLEPDISPNAIQLIQKRYIELLINSYKSTVGKSNV